MRTPLVLALVALLLLSTSTVRAEPAPLGRLFFDSQQRARLDQQRQRNPLFTQTSEDTAWGLTVNGEVRSSSGRRTRWINGEADWDNASALPRLPIGNSYHPESGKTTPLMGNGQLTVRPGGQ